MNQTKQKKNYTLFFLIEIIILFSLFFVFYTIQSLQDEQIVFSENRLKMIQMADKLRQSSDDLTHFVRTYAVTNDKKYKQQFLDILDIRNGLKARPYKYEYIYWDLNKTLRDKSHPIQEPASLKNIMNNLPYTDEERNLLLQSEKNSNDLVKLELEAFHAMNGLFKDSNAEFTLQDKANQALAIKILHSKEYYQAKQKIMLSIDKFMLILDERTLKHSNALNQTIKDYSIVSWVLIILFIIFNSYFVDRWYKYERDKQKKLDETIQERTRQLSDEKQKAEDASQFKSEFLANMSHEIRTPMNGILGFVNHLQKSEKDPKRIKEFQLIRSSGNTLLHIINDILDFSKIESGKMEVEYHPYNIHDIISETTGIFSELIGSKSIGLLRNIDESIPACIMGDQVRVKQVIFNLLSNAIKFTPEKGTITLDAKYLKATDQVQISVTDTGIGIPKDKLEKIFEAFGQQDASTTRKYGGTGLGLNISTKLIGKMGGTLHVESEVKKGSRFYFELPVVECSEVELEKEESSEDITEIQFSGHALIVEDNKTNQMLLSMILDDLGLSYDVANDGVEGLKCFSDNKYDIILMDENMPNMNGLEATNQIRLIEHDNEDTPTPIIAVTANALAEDKQRFLDAGMDDYIAKPYTEEDIVRVLQKYLG